MDKRPTISLIRAVIILSRCVYSRTKRRQSARIQVIQVRELRLGILGFDIRYLAGC